MSFFKAILPSAGITLAIIASAPGTGAKPWDPRLENIRAPQFVVREQFGVSHPPQIIDFDLGSLPPPQNPVVIGPDNVPVPFQFLSGNRLAVETAGLAAGTSQTWRLLDGPDGGATSDLRVTETDSHYEIVNLWTGVRVPKATLSLAEPPAPIGGVRLADGTWTGTGAVLPLAATAMVTRFLERGPLKNILQVEYRFADPARYYRSTITLEAGQPSVLIEEDANIALNYSFDCHPGIEPTQRRYQGHHASSPEKGRSLDGSDYAAIYHRKAPALAAGGSDAVADLQFADDAPSADATLPDDQIPSPSIRRIALWYPWIVDGGWYDMFYNREAGAEGNVLGIFAGRPSRALGAQRSGVGFFTRAGDATARRAGVTVNLAPQPITGSDLPRTRFGWGLFVGQKNTSLPADGVIPPINRQMNLHSGFNLNKLHRYRLDFSDPAGGWGGLFLGRAKLDALRQRVLTDPVYRDYAKSYAPGHVALFTADTDSFVRLVVNDTANDARAALDAYVNGSGISTFTWWYWIGAQVMNMRGMFADPVLADPLISAPDRDRLKACIALFGYILWDDDFVPFQTDSGLYIGNANMPRQQRGYRNLFALLLSGHPDFAAHAGAVTADVREVLRQSISESGAGDASPNYIHASVETALGLALMLQTRGLADLFADEPRLARFAEFFMQLQTPPEPRLAGRRGYLPIGDGELTPTELTGLLATGFRAVNPALSARLASTWIEGGRHQNHYSVPTLLLINDPLPSSPADLRSAAFPGYLSVLRAGHGSVNETACWLLGGEFYSDHRHNDRSSFMLYALGQPLATDWSDGYNPRVDGAYTKSAVVFADSVGGGWAADGPALSQGTNWEDSRVEPLVETAAGAVAQSSSRADTSTWTRRITLVHADPAHPLILIRDQFTGSRATEEKIMTLNLCADGIVTTPAGPITPPLRLAPQLPSASQVFDLPTGAQRFRFTGSFGIDFDVYIFGEQPQQGLLGNWGLKIENGPATGQIERQHILRIKGRGTFRCLIVPWRKGEEPQDLLVQSAADEISVRQNGRVTTFADTGYTVTPP